MNDSALPKWAACTAGLGSVSRLLVGFSGGVDSMVLLELARQWSWQSGLPLLAIHVNHQLSPNASAWQRHCEALCLAWGVPLQVQRVNVLNEGQGLEAAARIARYSAYARIASEQDLLLLGHHRDDQLETVLLRLLRGSGVRGLRGMSVSPQVHGIRILRPLLPFSKAELMAFARAKGWSWVEDESNASNVFDRNYLRNEVLPLVARRWPQYATAITRSAQHCSEAQALLDERAQEDLIPRLQDDGGLLLTCDNMPALSPARKRNLLRYWLSSQGFPLPSEALLEQILQTVLSAADDANPIVSWAGVDVRRYRRALYALKPLLPPKREQYPLTTLTSQAVPFGGELLIASAGDGVAVNAGRLRTDPLSLRLREGGEICKLHGRPSRPLKKILQESHLPPWWRERLPLLYLGETLAVIPGIGVCEGFQPQPDQEILFIGWKPPFPAAAI